MILRINQGDMAEPIVLTRCKRGCRDSYLKRTEVANHDGIFFQCRYCNRMYIVFNVTETYAQGDCITLIFKCIDKTFRPEECEESFHVILREPDEEVTIPNRL